jgi:hypothetical protein
MTPTTASSTRRHTAGMENSRRKPYAAEGVIGDPATPWRDKDTGGWFTTASR